ncbi:hypothetical protein HYC85_028171 [Camellia sinensis]|uniref:Uncharacterized protein n=1 Tax=Camellia sinensis TaxID=4442 RepID=A0A7J7FUE1_CAMSI|nr:hypothetical protein HYC85_028171 [Camellia sinensis]
MGGEDKKQMGQSPYSMYVGDVKDEDHQWEINGDQEDDAYNNGSSSSTSLGDSTASNGSSVSSSDMADDASSSSPSCSSTSSSNGPLSDLSDLMTQLPIKRGLSKFYDGKSQSFTSLSRVTSIEDLPKKESPYRRKMKASKSYGGGLDTYKFLAYQRNLLEVHYHPYLLPSRRGSFGVKMYEFIDEEFCFDLENENKKSQVS